MKKLFVSLLLVLGVVACSDETPELSQQMGDDASRSNITDVSISVGGGELDEIHRSFLPAGSRVLFWSVDSSQGIYDHSGEGLDRSVLTSSGEGSSQVWVTDNQLNFSGKAMAFYPYEGDIKNYTRIPVSYGTTDYLYSGFVSPSDGKWNICFNHVLTGVRIILEKDGYSGAGDITSITLQSKSLTDKGHVDASTGVVTPNGKGGVLSYPQSLTLDKNKACVTLLAVPTGVKDDINISFRVDGKDYEISALVDDFMSSKKLAFIHVLLTENGLAVHRRGYCQWSSVLDTENYVMSGMGENEYAVSIGHLSAYGQGGLYVSNVMDFVGMVDWGDGKVEEFNTPVDNPGHVYLEGRNYIVRFKGRTLALNNLIPVLPTTGCNYMIDRILNIGGDLGVRNLSSAFMGSKIDYLDGTEFRHIGSDVASFNKVFKDCSSLTELPGDLFESCSEAETFMYAFAGCSGLAELPGDLFENCRKVTDFSAAFADCTSLTFIPSNLFSSNTEVLAFGSLDMENRWSGVFAGCTSLTEIPEKLFSSCHKVQSFYSAFRGCRGLTSIPETLFASCSDVINFSNLFYGCSDLSSIPQTLFAHNTGVTDFSYAFQGCTGLTEVPEGLFRSCTEVLNFAGTFATTSLGVIPAGLFDGCRKVTDFRATFAECERLKGESPYTLINNGQTKVHLYQRNLYPKEFATPTDYDYCFWYGAGLADYENIPIEWK